MKSQEIEQATSDVVALLLAEIFENSAPGHHKLSTAQGFDVNSIRFAVRASDGYLFHEPEDISPEEIQALITRVILDQEYAAVSLQSKLQNGITEVRGWMVDSDGIKSVSPEDLIDAYSTDYETMTFKTPDPNICYRNDWT